MTFFSFENYGDQRHRKYFGPGLRARQMAQKSGYQ
jgi:hypothetical protein